MGCVSSKPSTRSTYKKETVHGIKLDEVDSKKGVEKFSSLFDMAKLGSRKIVPEEPKENSAIIHKDAAKKQSSNVTDIEVINVWELWDGLEEEEEEDCQEQSEEISNNSCSDEEDDDEALDHEFIAIENYSELEKVEVQEGEGFTRYNPTELQPRGSSIACVQDNDEQKAAEKGVERVEDKAPTIEFTKNMSLRDWLRQGSKMNWPCSAIEPQFGSFVFPEIEDEKSVFDPDMLDQYEQAMDELSTDEEMLLQQIVESLG